MKNAVCWDVAPCRSCVNRRFGRTYRLHLQGRRHSSYQDLIVSNEASISVVIVAQTVKKLSVFQATENLIAVLVRAQYWAPSRAIMMKTTPSHSICIRSGGILLFQVSTLQAFRPKPLHKFLIPLCMLFAPPIISFLILSH
jgi:hypothetical protein